MQAHFLKRYQCCKGIITALSQIDFELIHINGWNLLVQYTWSIVTAQANNTLKAKRNWQHESRGGCQVICSYQAYPGSQGCFSAWQVSSEDAMPSRASWRGYDFSSLVLHCFSQRWNKSLWHPGYTRPDKCILRCCTLLLYKSLNNFALLTNTSGSSCGQDISTTTNTFKRAQGVATNTIRAEFGIFLTFVYVWNQENFNLMLNWSPLLSPKIKILLALEELSKVAGTSFSCAESGTISSRDTHSRHEIWRSLEKPSKYGGTWLSSGELASFFFN